MPNQFLPLETLRRIVDSARGDLKQLRDIDVKLRAKIATVSNRQQFTSEHIRQESAKLRASAIDVAREYLVSEKTFSLLASMKDQSAVWSVPLFLARAATETGTNDVATLLKKTNLLLTLSRTSTASLADLAQAAVDRSDWTTLGTVYGEAQFRKQQGDEATGSLVAGISTVQLPDIATAGQLMAEAKQLEEYIGYALGAITTGEEDKGLKYEGWYRQAEERRAEQQQSRP